MSKIVILGAGRMGRGICKTYTAMKTNKVICNGS